MKYAKVFILCQISEGIFQVKVAHNSNEIGILHFDVDLRQIPRKVFLSFEVTVARAQPWPIRRIVYTAKT